MSDGTTIDDFQARKPQTTLTRRRLLTAGGAAALASSLPIPYVIRQSAAQSEPLSFWQFYTSGQNASQIKWFEDLVKAWNDANEPKIELEGIPGGAGEYYTKLSTSFAAGEGPDIFLLSPSDFLRYANSDILVDLTPYLEQAAIDDFYPGVMATRLVGDRIHGLPMEVEPLAMYYSLDAFEAAGLSEADIPQTWEQLLAVGQKLTTDDRYGLLFETIPGAYQVFTWYPFMWMGGGDIVAEDGAHSSFNNPGTIEALALWKEMIEKEVAPREVLGGGAWNVAANLVAGYGAIQQCGIWALSGLRDASPDFRYGVFKLPVPPGGTHVSIAGGWAFVASAKGKNPEAAARFIAWALGSMSEDSIERVVNWCTVAKTDMAPRKSVVERAVAQGAYSSGPLQVFAEQILPEARGEPRTPPEIWQLITDAVQACQLNGEDPATVAARTDEQIEAYLATYQGARIL